MPVVTPILSDPRTIRFTFDLLSRQILRWVYRNFQRTIQFSRYRPLAFYVFHAPGRSTAYSKASFARASILRAKALSAKVFLRDSDPGQFAEAVFLVARAFIHRHFVGKRPTRSTCLCGRRASERVPNRMAHVRRRIFRTSYPRPIPMLRTVPCYFFARTLVITYPRAVYVPRTMGAAVRSIVEVSPRLCEQTRYNICVRRIGTPNVHVERVYGFVFFFFSNI